MNNFTTNTYEMKRDILNFSKKITNGLDKPTTKFVSEMLYGIEKSNSILFSEIARALKEKIKLKNTIERLCDNCNALSNEELNIIKENYFNIALKQLPDDEIILIEDDSDINKEYSNKLEDLCVVRDASSKQEKYVNGYHVCEIVGLSRNEYQPISLYSKIYSTESKGFKSCPTETMQSEKYVIDKIRKNRNSKIIIVKDRGYDSFELFKETIDNEVSFVVRLDGNRHLLFKGKKKLVSDVASTRKGKIHTKLMYKGENTDCYISYTTVQLPKIKDKNLNLVIIYRKDEENDPMYLLTDLSIKTKEDVEKIARTYMLRWRIEEYFKSKKQNYDFENFRLRSLKAINNLNVILTCVMLHLGILTEKMNVKLLVIKIIEASESLKSKALVWYGQISKGISKILEHAHTGIKDWFEIEIREEYKQLKLKL
ncbi:MAG: transposase [Bacilli bacterium]